MNIYHFNPDNGVYVNTGLADPDPLDPEGYLIPAHCTTVPPPANVADGLVAVFDVSTETWLLMSTALFEQGNEEQPVTFSLDQLKSRAQKNIDDYFQSLYYATVPNGAIAAEYAAAYSAAKVWLTDTTMPPPMRVTALAESYQITEEQAAAVVVQKWDEAEIAQDRRGAARLRAKASIRGAANESAVFEAEAAGRLAMETVVFNV